MPAPMCYVMQDRKFGPNANIQRYRTANELLVFLSSRRRNERRWRWTNLVVIEVKVPQKTPLEDVPGLCASIGHEVRQSTMEDYFEERSITEKRPDDIRVASGPRLSAERRSITVIAPYLGHPHLSATVTNVTSGISLPLRL
ncbi:hypothetical protein CC2G_002891 [Coprinopsis cinerea AmutBmut pab1-1]|nr:hypothetical protein CC2G_002891 [Coprinopsis cinerea AmutBmut pab1-1]